MPLKMIALKMDGMRVRFPTSPRMITKGVYVVTTDEDLGKIADMVNNNSKRRRNKIIRNYW